MKIGLDFDGVVVNAPKLLSYVTEEVFGKIIPPEKFHIAHLLENKILSRDEWNRIKNVAYGSKKSLDHMVEVPGAIDAINTLQKTNNISIVTMRENGPTVEVARTWLEKNGLDVTVIPVGFGNSKADATVGMDIFMDDSLLKLYEIRDVVPHRFLYSWGYNEIYDEKMYAKRVKSWKEFVEEVNALEKK